MIDIAEQICQAVDKIVSERLKGVNYDTTITATIIDNSHANQYYYTVSTGEAQFVAFAAENTYKKDDSVLVTIPNNDYDQQKIIIGKNINKEDKEPYRYIKPFNTVVNVSGNIINNIGKVSLLANGDAEQIKVWTWDATASDLSLDGYTRIGLQGQFSSWLEEFNAIIGDYGYKLVVTSERDEVIGVSSSKETQTVNEGSNETGTASDTVETIFYLSSVADMIGNPYRFSAYHEQEKVFDISDLGKILKIELYFYQKPNSFLDANGVLVPTQDAFGNSLSNNLFAKDAYICFGYDVDEFKNEAAFLYSINSSTYNRTGTVEDNKKVINLRWIHRYEDGSLGVVIDLPTDYTIKWYRYRLGAPSADQYSGVYWEDVTPQGENNNIINSFSFILDPDTNRDTEQVKAIIYDANGKPVVRSNIMSFKNEDETVNNTTVQVLSGLIITCDDKMNGNYFMYGQNNQLFDESQQYKERILTVQFKDEDTGVTEATSITWTVPETNTMLKKLGESADKTSLSFTIKPTYNATATNNVISCTVVKDALTYTATFTPRFGLMGTNGTDATLVIDFDYPVLGVAADQDIIATLRLYDSQHNEIDLAQNTYSGKITWGLEGYTDKLVWGSPTNVEIISDEMAQNQRKLIFKGTSIPEYHSAIVTATLAGFGDYDLTVKKALPLTTDRTKYVGASIPTSIVYSTTGYADYFKEPISMKYNGVEDKDKIAYWSTWSPDMKYAGTISKKNILQPLKFYVKGANNYNILGYDKEDGRLLWAQPLVIMLNQYPSTTVNQWNGKNIELKENEGVILTPALAAGKKNNDNTFSGVMMGDWSNTNTAPDITKQTGLYGFHQGVVSFAFKEDGTAFIGKSGKGRIHFDGTNSTIKSELWDSDKSGLFMDLDDGVLKLQKTSEYILIWPRPTKATYNPTEDSPYYKQDTKYIQVLSQAVFDEYNTYYLKNKKEEYSYYYPPEDSYWLTNIWNKSKVELTKSIAKRYFNTDLKTQLYIIEDNQKISITKDDEFNEEQTYYLDDPNYDNYYTKSITYPPITDKEKEPFDENALYFRKDVNTQRYITLAANMPDYPLAIGAEKDEINRNFRVAWDGTCYITNGEISGTINADYLNCSNGRIGGWMVEDDKLIGVGEKVILHANDGIQLEDTFINLKYNYKGATGYGTIGLVEGSGVNDIGPSLICGDAKILAGFAHTGMSFGGAGGSYISMDNNGIIIGGNTISFQESPVSNLASLQVNGQSQLNGGITCNDCITTKGWIAVGYDEENKKAKIILNRQDGLIETSGNISLNGTINGAKISDSTIVTSSGTDLQYAYFG